MLDWLLLLPLLVPLLYASIRLIPASSRRWPPRLIAAEAFLLLELAAVLLNLLPFNHQLVISSWNLGSFAIAFEFDGVAVFLFLLVILIPAILWLVYPDRPIIDEYVAPLMSACLALVVAANLVTIFVCWVLVDGFVFILRVRRGIERETATRSFALSQLAALCLFAGTQFILTNRLELGSTLMGLALWARLGLWPFHWIYPMRGLDSLDLWTLRALPMLASTSLWIRWPQQVQSPPPTFLGLLFILHLGALLAWSWREEQPARTAIIGASLAAAFIPIGVLYGGPAGPAVTLWSTVCYVLSLFLFELALRWRAERNIRVARSVWALAIACIAGVPFTPGFPGRLEILFSLWRSDTIGILLLTSLAIPFVLAPLWVFLESLEGSQPRGLHGHELSGLAVALAGCFLLAVALTPLSLGLGPLIADSTAAALTAIDGSEALLGIIVSFVLLLIPFIISPWLRGLVRALPEESYNWIDSAGDFTDLSWLEPLAGRAWMRVGIMTRNLSDFAERNPTLWILFVALWIAIFVFVPR